MAEVKPLECLLVDLQTAIEKIRVDHRFWEVRIYGSDGQARVEIIVQQRAKYDLSSKPEQSK
jgi:hypothetical protein